MNVWRKVFGVVAPGGDPCWECPVCKRGKHIMGIETQYNHTNICENCGATVYYPWEIKRPVKHETI